MDLNMLKITSKNCYKWGLETVIDSNSQYFGILKLKQKVSSLISLISMVISQL